MLADDSPRTASPRTASPRTASPWTTLRFRSAKDRQAWVLLGIPQQLYPQVVQPLFEQQVRLWEKHEDGDFIHLLFEAPPAVAAALALAFPAPPHCDPLVVDGVGDRPLPIPGHRPIHYQLREAERPPSLVIAQGEDFWSGVLAIAAAVQAQQHPRPIHPAEPQPPGPQPPEPQPPEPQPPGPQPVNPRLAGPDKFEPNEFEPNEFEPEDCEPDGWDTSWDDPGEMGAVPGWKTQDRPASYDQDAPAQHEFEDIWETDGASELDWESAEPASPSLVRDRPPSFTIAPPLQSPPVSSATPPSHPLRIQLPLNGPQSYLQRPLSQTPARAIIPPRLPSSPPSPQAIPTATSCTRA